MVKIYTKTGDSGSTSLYDLKRLPKSDFRFDCLGDFDELNSHLGLLKAFYNEIRLSEDIKYYNSPGAGGLFYKTEKCMDSGKYYEWFILSTIVTNIQCIIMDISTIVATSSIKEEPIDDKKVIEIESLIDRLDTILPPIKNFVVPSGNRLISQFHICLSLIHISEPTRPY